MSDNLIVVFFSYHCLFSPVKQINTDKKDNIWCLFCLFSSPHTSGLNAGSSGALATFPCKSMCIPPEALSQAIIDLKKC